MNRSLLFAISMVVGQLACCLHAQEQPLKVFVLVGQSNMQGHAHVRTLPQISMNSETKSLWQAIVDDQGQPRIHRDVWISSLSSSGVKTGQLTTGFGADENKFGPELAFGVFMQQRLDEPILIIKAAWGGKSLHTDFRPPSAGPFEFEPSVLERLKDQGKDMAKVKSEKEKAVGLYYQQTIDHVQSVLADIKSVYPDYDSKQGFELAGLVWFQGWNDMVDQDVYPSRGKANGYRKYSEVFRCLIRDFRRDLASAELPIVIGVLGVGGPTNRYGPSENRYTPIHQGFRDAMAAPANDAEFSENVVAVLTEQCWDTELSDLVSRDSRLKSHLKQRQSAGEFKKNEWQAKLKEARETAFSQEEQQALTVGVSNAAYHYLGSGKIMAQIGRAFADAIVVERRQRESDQ